jgi:hypothetical protein
MANEKHSRLVLLNYMISDATTKAPQEHKAPLHNAEELFAYLEQRISQGVALEVFDSERSDDDDENVRIAASRDHNFIRLKKLKLLSHDDARYAVMLIETVDHKIRTMPVLDVVNFTGRDIAGEENERGTSSAHVAVRLPNMDSYDDGRYRCVVEAVTGISRKKIETLFNRQLRRFAKANNFTFDVDVPHGRGKRSVKSYIYYPKILLATEVGRTPFSDERELASMVFTRRAEKQRMTSQTSMFQDEVIADVEYRVSAQQGPRDSGERLRWLSSVRNWYESKGYKTKLYFRHIGKSAKISGNLHQSLEGAADIMICAREEIETAVPQIKWVDDIQPEVQEAMIGLLKRDELWKHKDA